jgi:signal transduction histidine kinase
MLMNGRELTETNRSGIGFGGMRERVRQLGGTLEVRSNGTGTMVKAVLKLGQPEVIA